MATDTQQPPPPAILRELQTMASGQLVEIATLRAASAVLVEVNLALAAELNDLRARYAELQEENRVQDAEIRRHTEPMATEPEATG